MWPRRPLTAGTGLRASAVMRQWLFMSDASLPAEVFQERPGSAGWNGHIASRWRDSANSATPLLRGRVCGCHYGVYRDSVLRVQALIRSGRPKVIDADHHVTRPHEPLPRHRVRRFDRDTPHALR